MWLVVSLASCNEPFVGDVSHSQFFEYHDQVQETLCPTLLAKLDRYDVLVLDDLGYVRKDQAETIVLFELIAERYERKSLITTCNQPFSEWNQIFPDPAMTVAAIDRLVHHATILELNTESYRRRSALTRGAKLAASQLPAKAASPPA